MKPIGPIPSGYSSQNGELCIGGQCVSALIEHAGGTPLFVYAKDRLDDRVAQLRAAMPQNLHIHYAVKANPYGPMMAHMAGLVDGFDIASGGELAMAMEAGLDPKKISFAGPGKRDDELTAAIKAGATLNLESENEGRRAIAIGQSLGLTPRLAIRVNPDFELRGSGMKMGGGAKPFGLDQARVPALAREIIESGAEWCGLHIFTGSQALSAEAIIEAQGNVIDLADQLAQEIGAPLPKLNMGGGLGIPYFNGDQPVDLAAIGAALQARFDNLPPSLADCYLCIELGRYLVGEAGVYLTRIIDRKTSHETLYLITDGGLHHQLAASGNFGTVVRRNYPVAIASKFDEEAVEEANIVGCLCTPLDRLADAAQMPRAEVGDIVAVFCAGAYGASASPENFLGQGAARQILI